MPLANASFELPAGTSGSVTTVPAEPFALTHGATLLVAVDGGAAQTVLFDSADFANIAAATAAEVVAVLDAQLAGADATASAGRVVLTSLSQGDASCIEITGGQANTVLQFPPTEDCGVTTPGQAQSWMLSFTAAAEETGGFDSAIVEEPVEDFEEGWDTVSVSNTYTLGAFGSVYVFNVERFETEWSGNEGYLFALGPLASGTFDSATPEAFEDFEEEWSDNESFVTGFTWPTDANLSAPKFTDDFEQSGAAPTYSAGTFDNNVSNFAEDFEEATLAVKRITVVSAVNGTYRLFSDGVLAAQFVSSGHTTSQIASGLIADFNSRGVVPELTANNQTGGTFDAALVASIFKFPPFPLLTVQGPSSGDISIDDPDEATLWTGVDHL